MPSDPSHSPSVACLLYLAADQIAPRGMSGKMLKATKVPCRPVWVQPIRLSATIAAATFLSLRDTAKIKLDLQEVTFKDPTYKMPTGRFRTHQTLTLTEADTSPQGGLAGALLAITRDLPDELLGQFGARGGWSTMVASSAASSPAPLSGTWSGYGLELRHGSSNHRHPWNYLRTCTSVRSRASLP